MPILIPSFKRMSEIKTKLCNLQVVVSRKTHPKWQQVKIRLLIRLFIRNSLALKNCRFMNG